MRLDGRLALITGGTQGVGAAIARALAKSGCDLVLHGLRDDENSRETAEQCLSAGVQVAVVYEDFSRPIDEWLSGFAQAATVAHDRVPDLLINNAGVFCDKPFLEMDLATYQRTFSINVESGYFLTQYFAKKWIEANIEGRVLFTGSINGQLAEVDHTAYDTSKGAVHSMVRSLCVALAPHRIRVNAMAPGLVVTPLTQSVLEPGSDDLEWMKMHTPNGKVPGPEACGATALFLLSDQAEHIHGQTIMVDGGMSVWQQPELPDSIRGKIS
ncbi:MAG: SDR family oxidoreductase [Aureliella sp.]